MDLYYASFNYDIVIPPGFAEDESTSVARRIKGVRQIDDEVESISKQSKHDLAVVAPTMALAMMAIEEWLVNSTDCTIRNIIFTNVTLKQNDVLVVGS